MFCRELEVRDDLILQIDQQPEGDTGVVIWDAALVLAKYLELLKDGLSGKIVVELGSGTGAVGLAAAALGARVIISDLQENLHLLQHNIDKNKDLNLVVEAAVLKWGDSNAIKAVRDTQDLDYILVADCVYYDESLEDLTKTIEGLSTSKTQIIVAYEDRDSDQKIELQRKFRLRMEEGFSCVEIPLADQHEEYRSPDIHILEFKLK